jgi:predicted house-cleaning noncanonical NTP pyrophosphatase (MazG superfamily)
MSNEEINKVALDTSDSTIKFLIWYEGKKWKIQLVLKDNPIFPIISTNYDLWEENEKRNEEIMKLMLKKKIDGVACIEIVNELMDRAGLQKNELEDLKEGKTQKKIPLTEKYTLSVITKAYSILNNGDPFNFFMKQWEKDYAVTNNDYSLGAMTLCVIASTQISNSKGLHEKVGGPSGFGKSTGITTMFKLFPPEKTLVSSMSAKSIFYVNIKAGTVVYCDDIDLSKEDFFTTVK